MPGTAFAQGAAEPLRPGPADFWSDVHRWTGSEATRPVGPAARPAPVGGARAAPGALRQVITSRRSRANLRRDPGLDAPVLRVLPPGTALNVFAEADGGWLQVGEDRAAGWMHESVLDR
ncbi:SH3 domain-containing protein [Roseomonas sp. HF4]|uniref:SH3 domain-containing protein n=1 Tax=Roseomonas sp. HF4 TaxID=2562313 RepID=UPI001484FBB1|nr:SH3 domain-containing protein [Roseomonas sp. HF4]